MLRGGTTEVLLIFSKASSSQWLRSSITHPPQKTNRWRKMYIDRMNKSRVPKCTANKMGKSTIFFFFSWGGALWVRNKKWAKRATVPGTSIVARVEIQWLTTGGVGTKFYEVAPRIGGSSLLIGWHFAHPNIDFWLKKWGVNAPIKQWKVEQSDGLVGMPRQRDRRAPLKFFLWGSSFENL